MTIPQKRQTPGWSFREVVVPIQVTARCRYGGTAQAVILLNDRWEVRESSDGCTIYPHGLQVDLGGVLIEGCPFLPVTETIPEIHAKIREALADARGGTLLEATVERTCERAGAGSLPDVSPDSRTMRLGCGNCASSTPQKEAPGYCHCQHFGVIEAAFPPCRHWQWDGKTAPVVAPEEPLRED